MRAAWLLAALCLTVACAAEREETFVVRAAYLASHAASRLALSSRLPEPSQRCLRSPFCHCLGQGYKETGVGGTDSGGEAAAQGAAGELAKPAGQGDGSLNAAGAGAGQATGQQQQQGAAGQQAAAADTAAQARAAETPGRTVLVHTQFGPIRVKLLEQLAPRTTALVWELAQRRGCRDCAFYR